MATKKDALTITNNFMKFNDELGKIMKKGGKDIDPVEFITLGEITEFIPFGNYLLNAQISGDMFGGMPNARSLEIAGESGCLPPDEKIKIYVMKTKSSNCFNIEHEK